MFGISISDRSCWILGFCLEYPLSPLHNDGKCNSISTEGKELTVNIAKWEKGENLLKKVPQTIMKVLLSLLDS